MSQPTRVLVLDGHDGSGKTALARSLAEVTGAVYVRPFADSLGEMIAWLWQRSDFEFANRLARAAVQRMMDLHQDAPVLVFDRHWLTMFSVLPAEYRNEWMPLPQTVLCWTDVETTCRRVRARNEAVQMADRHEFYCAEYRRLAEEYNVPLLDTRSMEVRVGTAELVRLFGLDEMEAASGLAADHPGSASELPNSHSSS